MVMVDRARQAHPWLKQHIVMMTEIIKCQRFGLSGKVMLGNDLRFRDKGVR